MAVIFSAAAFAFASAYVCWWLWRTPLAVRVHAAGGLDRAAEGSGAVTLKPFIFDLVRERLTVCLRVRLNERVLYTRPLIGGEKKPEPEPEKKKGAGLAGALRAFRFIDRFWGVQEIALYLVSCRRFFSVEEFSGYIEFGSEEPEQTGELYGYLCAATPLWEQMPEFSFRPNWSPRDSFEFDLTLALGFYVFRLVCSALWFAVSRFRWRELFAKKPGQKPGHKPANRLPPAAGLPEARRHAA